MAWEPTRCQHCRSTLVEYVSDDPKNSKKEIWHCQSCKRKFSFVPKGKED